MTGSGATGRRGRLSLRAGVGARGDAGEGSKTMYATKQTFDGQRASVSRSVVVKKAGDMWAGVIESIVDDQPEIYTLNDGDQQTYKFATVKTEADIEEVPDDSWFWPPRV